MKRTIIAAALALVAAPALAQDSNNCVSLEWTKRTKNGNGTTSHRHLFTNNCSWNVKVCWRTNDFGRSMCGRTDKCKTLMYPGESDWGTAMQVPNGTAARISYCAEAADRGHPDYDTCSGQASC